MRAYAFSEPGAAMPAIVLIQKSLETIAFTTWDRAVMISGVEYSTAPSADVTGFVTPGDATASNCDITVMAVEGGLFAPGDGVRGLLDGWPITVSIFDPADLVAGASIIIDGTIGSVDEDANGMLVIAANGPLRLAQARPLTEHYSLVCRADLGDDLCKAPICGDIDPTFYDIGRGQAYVTTGEAAPGLQTVKDCYGRVRTGSPDVISGYANRVFQCTTAGTTDATTPSYNATIGATTADGTAVFTCRDAFLRYATGAATGAYTIVLDSLPDARASDDTWYVDGALYVRSGNLEGYPKLTIRAWDAATKTLTLFLPIDPDDIPPGTEFEIYPGCDRTRDQCFVRFNNITNLRAETMVPMPDFSATVPQRKIDNIIDGVNTLMDGISYAGPKIV